MGSIRLSGSRDVVQLALDLDRGAIVVAMQPLALSAVEPDLVRGAEDEVLRDLEDGYAHARRNIAGPPLERTRAVRAAAPRGVLTAVEYRSLTRELVALKRALGASQPDWQAANAACRRRADAAGYSEPSNESTHARLERTTPARH